MVFREYKYGAWKSEIKNLLRKRFKIKDKIRYHKLKIEYFEKDILPKIQKELNDFLLRAGNTI